MSSNQAEVTPEELQWVLQSPNDQHHTDTKLCFCRALSCSLVKCHHNQHNSSGSALGQAPRVQAGILILGGDLQLYICSPEPDRAGHQCHHHWPVPRNRVPLYCLLPAPERALRETPSQCISTQVRPGMTSGLKFTFVSGAAKPVCDTRSINLFILFRYTLLKSNLTILTIFLSHTEPERVSPAVSNRGTNNTIEVTWTSPPGNVENYMVNLTSDYGDNQSRVLNSSFHSHLFSGLTAGRNYTVTVTTISGPFAEESDPVSNATCEYNHQLEEIQTSPV